MLTFEERDKLMKTIFNDMTELIKTDKKIIERIKTDEVGIVYDLLRSIFFGEDDRCIYNDGLTYYKFNRYYGNNVRSRIRYAKNKMLGVNTTQPDNFCIGIVLEGKWNYINNASFPDIELEPFAERMTYLSARRKINNLNRHVDSPLMRYVIYRIEENGDYTVMY